MSVNDNERPHTLYCIGGSLDGQMHEAGLQGFSIYCSVINGTEHYRRRELAAKIFESDGVRVHWLSFWVVTGVRRIEPVLNRARELFVDAAILQDEQLICE